MQTRFNEEQLYEIVEYADELPFRIHNILRESLRDEYGNMQNVLEHWHQELEIVYTIAGHARHYIDGHVYEAAPGKMFITNSESIHKIISDAELTDAPEVIAVVLNIDAEFMNRLLPNMEQMYFLPEVNSDMKKIRTFMLEFLEYADGRKVLEPFEHLKLTGMLYELLALLCRDNLAWKESVFPINNQKNLERLRGIMEYVDSHYQEEIVQHEVAKRFYFTKEYFSRFFRKNTGMTFKEYVTRFRVNKARKEIVETRKTILEIALDNGFADARGLINAFRTIYGTTPLKYRKAQEELCKKL